MALITRGSGILALILAGCATPIPPAPEKVFVPVATSCVKTVPLKPVTHSDAVLLGMDDYKLALAIFQDRRLLLDYTSELEALLNACR